MYRNDTNWLWKENKNKCKNGIWLKKKKKSSIPYLESWVKRTSWVLVVVVFGCFDKRYNWGLLQKKPYSLKTTKRKRKQNGQKSRRIWASIVFAFFFFAPFMLLFFVFFFFNHLPALFWIDLVSNLHNL